CRATVRRWCCRTSWWGHPTLVISPGKSVDSVVLSLLRAPTSGFRPVAVTDPNGECRSALVPVVSDAALEAAVHKYGIRYAVVSVSDTTNASVVDLVNRYATLIPH